MNRDQYESKYERKSYVNRSQRPIRYTNYEASPSRLYRLKQYTSRVSVSHDESVTVDINIIVMKIITWYQPKPPIAYQARTSPKQTMLHIDKCPLLFARFGD